MKKIRINALYQANDISEMLYRMASIKQSNGKDSSLLSQYAHMYKQKTMRIWEYNFKKGLSSGKI